MTRRCSWFELAAVLCLFSGCGPQAGAKSESLSTVSVEGVATFEGKPLESYRVMFTPTSGDRVASGVTDADGKFKLGTNEPGDGAPTGTYKVALAFEPQVEGDPSIDNGIDNPAKYPKPKVKIPPKFASPDKSGITVEVPSGGLTDYKLELK